MPTKSRFSLFALLVVGVMLTLRPEPARAVSYTPSGSTMNCVKRELIWNDDGTKTIIVACKDSNGTQKWTVPFTLDATKVYDRFGNVVTTQSAGFQTAMSTVATSVDSAISAVAGGGTYLDPP